MSEASPDGLADSVGKVLILTGVYSGMHDLRNENGGHTFTWNDKEYR